MKMNYSKVVLVVLIFIITSFSNSVIVNISADSIKNQIDLNQTANILDENLLVQNIDDKYHINPISDFFHGYYLLPEKRPERANKVFLIKGNESLLYAKDYDRNGYLSDLYYYSIDLSTKKATLKGCYVFIFDNRHNIIQIENHDNNYNLIPFCDCGYTIIRMSYDKYNRIFEEATYDAQMKPKGANGRGWPYKMLIFYSRSGDYVEMIRILSPIDNFEASYEVTFDQNGRKLSEIGEY